MNVSNPRSSSVSHWPKCSFFGVYDGHGGHAVADYLRDTLHQTILQDPLFATDPKAAIQNGCRKTESALHSRWEKNKDKSGSCAVVVLVIE